MNLNMAQDILTSQEQNALKSLINFSTVCILNKLFSVRKKSENETSTRASYKVAYVFGKKGKPFTDGSIIKK